MTPEEYLTAFGQFTPEELAYVQSSPAVTSVIEATAERDAAFRRAWASSGPFDVGGPGWVAEVALGGVIGAALAPTLPAGLAADISGLTPAFPYVPSAALRPVIEGETYTAPEPLTAVEAAQVFLPGASAAPTPFGQSVIDAASNGSVYDQAWLTGQLAALDEQPLVVSEASQAGSAAESFPAGDDPASGGAMSIWSDLGMLLEDPSWAGLGTVGSDVISAFAQPGSGTIAGSGVRMPSTGPAAGTVAPRGYHWSAKRGKWVKNRRLNPLNIHALRRALRRAEGFIKVEKRVDKIVNRAARYSARARRHGFVRGAARSGRSSARTMVNIEE